MLYPKQMATQTSQDKTAVNSKLRRKMLERWENEGGKVGEINLSWELPDVQQAKSSGKQPTKRRTTKGKK